MKRGAAMLDMVLAVVLFLWLGTVELEQMTWKSWLIGAVLAGYFISYPWRRWSAKKSG